MKSRQKSGKSSRTFRTDPSKRLKMKNILTIMTAGIIALLSLNSCDVMYSEFDNTTCEAYLTCFYAGGMPSASAQQSYELDSPLRDRDIEAIFNELSSMVQPGFMSATLEIDFFDWMDNYDYTKAYDFWWESTDILNGEGYYAWDERME